MNVETIGRRIWYLNGLVLLPILLLALWSLANEILKNSGVLKRGPRISETSETRADTSVSKAIWLGNPNPMNGAPYYVISVYHAEAPVRSELETEFLCPEQRRVNAIILGFDGSARLLFPERACIKDLQYPGSEEDSQLEVILVQAATKDTDGNHRIDVEDERQLFIAPVDGAPLTPIVPDSVRFTDATVISHGRQVFLRTVQRVAGDSSATPKRGRQLAYVYDLPSGRLELAVGVNEAALTAGHLVGK